MRLPRVLTAWIIIELLVPLSSCVEHALAYNVRRCDLVTSFDECVRPDQHQPPYLPAVILFTCAVSAPTIAPGADLDPEPLTGPIAFDGAGRVSLSPLAAVLLPTLSALFGCLGGWWRLMTYP